ncbi:hypothetical protein [Streptomyces sp. NPDC093109]|uniref:hypothetical protein n=1 Tax=Streptomyces sp. NPDC093109 TaxID=3154977 RepID=UPI00344D3B2F
MTESESTHFRGVPVLVLGVVEGDPPFRIVEIHGEPAGKAYAMEDVVRIAFHAGLTHIDLDDLDTVRWVGGGKYTWHVRHWL